MTLTPVEIRHLKPARSLVGGYKRPAVEALMDEIVASFEDVWRERADLADKVEQLEVDLVRYRELEALLRTTLVSAEKSAVTLKEGALRGPRDHAVGALGTRPPDDRGPSNEITAAIGARARRRRAAAEDRGGRSGLTGPRS